MINNVWRTALDGGPDEPTETSRRVILVEQRSRDPLRQGFAVRSVDRSNSGEPSEHAVFGLHRSHHTITQSQAHVVGEAVMAEEYPGLGEETSIA
jgi:hypothetical protein